MKVVSLKDIDLFLDGIRNGPAKVAELHATLAALRRESEQKIEKLKAENEEATKAIERLQSQLKQQTDFNSLKNNLM